MLKKKIVRAVFLGIITGALWVSSLRGAPIAVRFPEGPVHGFLVVRSSTGETLGYGEQFQVPRDATVESRLVLRFNDGSLHNERVIFEQRKVFTVRSYSLVQRGPSFPKPLEASLDRPTQQYKVKHRKNDAEKLAEGRLELPADLYNGMQSIALKNLDKETSQTVQLAAFTPEPKIVEAKLSPAGRDRFFHGQLEKQAIRYLLKPQLGVLGIVASLIGKNPPEYHYWISDEAAPGFLAFEGPLYLDGPVWSVELSSPRWSQQSQR
jgi:hypothetical protein